MPQETSHTLNCNVQTEVRVPCGASHISAAECEAINCCFDGQSCYFGRAVTVQCTKDGQFIVVVSKDSTSPRLDLTSFSLLGTGPGCTYADSNYQFAIYQFPVTQCGSQVMEDSDAIIYENRLFSSFEVGVGPYGSITRDSHFELLFQCKYTTSAVLPVVVEVVRVDNPIRPVAAVGPNNVQLRLANGQCQTKGCNAEAAAYTSYYTEYPVTKVLRDPVYVEVQLMDKTDPLLVLRLGRCWVTTSPNPHTLPQWDILIDGCPYKDDRYLSALIPIEPSAGLDPSHYRRFVFKMFTFVDTSTLSPLSQQIYIHCSTDMCGAKPGHNCEPSCYRRRRDVDALVPENAEPKAVGTVGPILISKPDQ
ncbi:zona pellucida sperm-binding protein 4-like isoform X2 [Eucyclogobius newberryi]|uniref:zona pellucida sperm-binding protein 4-like isoform X2 n=1 Tax=Eucyclogobius newberryi TaxID=166745 RepID=UPI003B5AF5D2